MMEEHCQYYEPSDDDGDMDELALKCRDIETYMIYLDFDLINDEKERDHFKNIPTSFVLEEEQVEQLKEISRTLLTHSTTYQQLINDLNRRYK